MQDLALVVNNDIGLQEQGQDYVKADTDNGYYRVANELGLALCKVSLSDREGRLVHAVMMKTFGFNKSMDWICNAQLSELTDISIGHIGETKTRLFHRKILIKNGRQIGVNAIVSEWQINPKQGLNKKPETRFNKTLNRVRKNPKQGSEKPETRLHNRQDTNTKDTITKDNKVLTLPDWLPSELWQEFISMRKSIKKPLTENAIKRMLKKLQNFQDSGINAPEQLIYSIDNCYSDVYAPKNHQKPMQKQKALAENFEQKDYGITTIPEFMQNQNGELL